MDGAMTAKLSTWWMPVVAAAVYFAGSPCAAQSSPSAANVAAPAASPAVSPAAAPSPAVDGRADHGAEDGHAGGKLAEVAPPLMPGRKMYLEEHDQADVHASTSWAVMAHKSRQELVVYYKSRLYKKYHAVFGRNLDRSVKIYEGDRRTPEGAYRIISKETNPRFTRFLGIDYPNGVDMMRYRESKAAREIPKVDGRLIGQGGRIGIHGTDDPRLNRTGVNWTTGCISVNNGDVLELDWLLPVGTYVIIKP